LLIYLYDESGSPIGLKYRTSAYTGGEFNTFFFEKNLQGDIIAIYDETGSKIGSYTYDAWGKHTYSTVSGNTSLENRIVSTYNPFRYRGYFYDVETQWYYLQSRYYNPNWGRFISADGYISTGTGLLGYNMYAYCNNNPMTRVDPSGEFGYLIQFGALLVSYASTAVVAIFDEDVREDMNRIKWNPFNTDASATADSTNVSFYKGQFVIREDWAITNGRSGSFVFMFLNVRDNDEETIKHEWGHFVQFAAMHPLTYLTSVAIPSVFSDNQSDIQYYSNPWERTSDWIAGINRKTGYKPASMVWGMAYIGSPLLVTLAYSILN